MEKHCLSYMVLVQHLASYVMYHVELTLRRMLMCLTQEEGAYQPQVLDFKDAQDKIAFLPTEGTMK